MDLWLTPYKEVFYWSEDGRTPLFLLCGVILKDRRSVLWTLWGAINSWILQNPGTGQNSLLVEHGPMKERFQTSMLFVHLSPSPPFLHFFCFFSSLLLSYFSDFFSLQFSPPWVSAAMAVWFYTWKSSWLWMENKISQFFSDLASYACNCQPWKTDKPSSDSLNIKTWVFQLILRLACQILLFRAVLRGN